MENIPESPRVYFWNYFALHAENRMRVFQYFVTLSVAIGGGLVFLIGLGKSGCAIILLTLSQCFVSFIFWRLDCRLNALVENAERVLKIIDRKTKFKMGDDTLKKISIFDIDDSRVAKTKAKCKSLSFFVTHSGNFKATYLFFAALSILALIFAICKELMGS